ncbi:MAG: tRNA (uridine(54)-C5)-methyltransferase TrmA [Campylobacterota bacterium]
MTCEHFGKCGSCYYYDLSFDEQFARKKEEVQTLLAPFYSADFALYYSPKSHFRARAEFGVYKDGDSCYLAMKGFDKERVAIGQCPKVLQPIDAVAFGLIEEISKHEILAHKLFSVEFLSGLSGQVLVTLIYHKRLEQTWQAAAQKLQERFGISVIGRSRKQKVVLDKDFITEKLSVKGRTYLQRQYDTGFTQPNPKVNEKMIEWAMERVDNSGDLLESYCGAGNFTLPLSTRFDKVLAAEIAKKSIQAAKENCEQNKIDNIAFARLSSQELTQALQKQRTFTRLQGIDLDTYSFTTVLVDPPRAGLDEDTIKLISAIKRIIYISCNPETLARDLWQLSKTHVVTDAAVFDQFAYSKHIETGIILDKKEE